MATKAIVGQKVGMTQVWDDQNRMIPVTVLQVEPLRVVQIRTPEKDGYSALQVTFGHKKASKLTKPVAGQYEKSGVEPGIRLVELRLDDVSGYEIGQEISVAELADGDLVDVTAVSKGKGFAGTIKRHNFHRQRKTHGGKGNTRKPGSIGSMYPQHVMKGKKMAGHLGNEQVTVRNLKIALVDTELQVIGVIGAVPGPRKSIVIVKGAK